MDKSNKMKEQKTTVCIESRCKLGREGGRGRHTTPLWTGSQSQYWQCCFVENERQRERERERARDATMSKLKPTVIIFKFGMNLLTNEAAAVTVLLCCQSVSQTFCQLVSQSVPQDGQVVINMRGMTSIPARLLLELTLRFFYPHKSKFNTI